MQLCFWRKHEHKFYFIVHLRTLVNHRCAEVDHVRCGGMLIREDDGKLSLLQMKEVSHTHVMTKNHMNKISPLKIILTYKTFHKGYS